MDIQKLSGDSLLVLHGLIREAIQADDKTPGKVVFGVRVYPDWRKQADGFEAEMTKRGIHFDKLPW